MKEFAPRDVHYGRDCYGGAARGRQVDVPAGVHYRFTGRERNQSAGLVLRAAVIALAAIAFGCAPKELPAAKVEATPAHLKPVSTGYGVVNGMKLYHEMYGEGNPLVLLHGGLMTIGEMAPLTQALAGHRKVIAVELQGHGRTADTDRPRLALNLTGLRPGVNTEALDECKGAAA